MLSDLKYRLRAIFRRGAMERELEHELTLHYEREVEKLVAGGEARGISTLESTLRDLQYGARQLRKSPGFSTVIVVSLALGIGANTAIFTFIDSVLLRSLPVADPDSLYFVARYQPTLGPSPGYGYGHESSGGCAPRIPRFPTWRPTERRA